MAMPKCLMAGSDRSATVDCPAATACDDYPEEMALAAAQRDAELAKSATAQQAPAAQVARRHSASLQRAPMRSWPAPAQPQTTANLAGALRR